MEYWCSEELYGLVNTIDPTVFFRKMCHNIGGSECIRLPYSMPAMGGLRRKYNDSVRKDPDVDVRSAYEEQTYL